MSFSLINSQREQTKKPVSQSATLLTTANLVRHTLSSLGTLSRWAKSLQSCQVELAHTHWPSDFLASTICRLW